MEFDWPDWKSDKCLAERGFDFDFAARLFDGSTVEFLDDRKPYPETRFIAFGAIDGVRYAVVYFDRDDGTRFILSARRARATEVLKWQQHAEAGR